ncbi:MAG: 50S ribosomal protein L11 methyltransferase [Planctomycetes bacterium]|nr:50S ribosomal protein L11 methyltransferase [Planctomycetota bacterium]
MQTDDSDYFHGYASAEVHRMMLADRARTDAYRRAIEAVVRPGATVLDVGAGTGILSLFAARAGARRVYAVDESEILETTRELVRRNGYAGVIECVDGRAEEVDLPERVDVLVSEWMGLFGLTEAMFESVVAATHKHLAPAGVVIPGALRLCLAPVRDDELYARKGLGFWTPDLYGFDYTPMVRHELRDLETNTVDGRRAIPLAAPRTIARFDAYTTPAEAYWFDEEVTFEVLRGGPCHGFLGWFEAELAEGVLLSTAADQPYTHWRQSWFPLKERALQAGDLVELRLRATRDVKVDARKPLYFAHGRVVRAGAVVDEFHYGYASTYA